MVALSDRLIQLYGNEAGPQCKFQSWIGLRVHPDEGSIEKTRVYLQYCYAIYVSNSNINNWATVNYTGTLNGKSLWSGSCSLSQTGWHADSDWINYGWVDRGSTISMKMVSDYYGNSGGHYESIAESSATVPTYLAINYYTNGADYCTFNGEEIEITSDNTYIATDYFYYDVTHNTGLANVQNPEYLYVSKTGNEATGNWYLEANGVKYAVDQDESHSGQTLAKAFGTTLPFDSNKTLDVYPEWEPLPYKVYLYCDGYTMDGSGVIEYDAFYGGPVGGSKYGTQLPTPYGSGQFQGWNDSPDGSGQWYTGSEIRYSTEDLTLYAIWGLIPVIPPVSGSSYVALYVDRKPIKGVVKMYNAERKLCDTILTVYDQNGKRYTVK